MSYSSFTKEQIEKKKIIQDLAEQVKAALKKSQN